jgi:serine/threonine-protein kinase
VLADQEDDRERMRAAGTIDNSRPRLWEHPLGDVMMLTAACAGRPALVTFLRATERMRDALLVARVEAVHRVLQRGSVPHALRVQSVQPAPDGELLLLYPAVQGEGLVNVLREGPLPPSRALAVLRQVCRSLAAAHAVGIEHHVLSPASIVFLREGDPEAIGILDYGIAPLFEGHDRSECAELHPITPEAVTGGGTGFSEDIYLVGCLAYQMLSGEPPFRGDDLQTLRRRHAIEDPKRLDELPIAALPAHVVDAVARALEKEPDDRFASIAELEAALMGAPRGQTRAYTEPPRAAPRRAVEPEKRRIEPALVFAPGRRREQAGPVLASDPKPTVQVEPGSLLRGTSIAIRRPDLSSTPAPKVAKRRHRPRKLAAATLGLALLVAAGVIGFAGEEPPPVHDVQTAAVVPPRVRDGGPTPEPVEPVAAADELPLPPTPGPIPPPTAATEAAPPKPIPVVATAEPAPPRRERPEPRKTRTDDAREHVVEAASNASELCALTRRAAVDARGAHDWQGLLRHTAHASCWASADDRLALRIKALMELGRFTECVRLGHRVSRPQADVQLWTRLCSKRSDTET